MDYIINSVLILIFLEVVLVVLKLQDFLTVSWWFVTAPLWVILVIISFIFFIFSNLHF